MKPDYEHGRLMKYAIQSYLSNQGITHLDMNRESWSRAQHDLQMRINMHLYDASLLMAEAEREKLK